MISRIAFFISVCLMFYSSFFFYARWQQKNTEAVIAYDVSGYYWYLPSFFIYHDFKHQSFKDSILNKYRPTDTDFQQCTKCSNGNYVMKYSSGMAFMYLPFFAIAHLLAGYLGCPRDGFSTPYQFAIQLVGFLMAILGLWYLRKLLLLYYKDNVVAIVILLLVFGSNYLNYAVIDCGMSHSWLFTVYVFLLLNTHYFYKTYKLKYAIRIGLFVGLCTLTRPTDVISCLIPLFWGLEGLDKAALSKHFSIIGNNIKSFALSIICAVLVVSIQLFYWKFVTGHWLFYSYGEDQTFSFFHPHPVLYTFSYKTGWLRYSPMVLLSFVGILPFLKTGLNKFAILAFILINFYIVCSWDCWWFGGRAMIQSYPVLLFPMAALVEFAICRKVWKLVLSGFVALFLYINIWITYMYHKGNLYDADSMSKSYYWHVIGRWTAPDSLNMLKDSCDIYGGNPKSVRLIYENGFEKDTGAFYVSTNAISGNKSLILTKEQKWSPTYEFDFTDKNVSYLKCIATFRCKNREWDAWKMTHFIVRLIDKSKSNNEREVKHGMLKVYRFLNNGDTKEIGFWLSIPDKYFDKIEIQFWNRFTDNEILIDDIKILAIEN